MHTPGPWAKPYFEHEEGDKGWWIHNGQQGADEFAVAVTFELNPNAKDDANLIAAAPELLEALKDMLSGWKYIRESHGDLYGVGWDRAQEKAESAIAKALGQPVTQGE